MAKPPIDLEARCKLWLGPDFEAEGEGVGKARDIEFFDTVAEALQRYQKLGPRKYGARIETSAGEYGQAEIEAAWICDLMLRFADALRMSPEPQLDDTVPSMRIPEVSMSSCDAIADEIVTLAKSPAAKAEKLEIWLELEQRAPNHLSAAFKRDIIDALVHG